MNELDWNEVTKHLAEKQNQTALFEILVCIIFVNYFWIFPKEHMPRRVFICENHCLSYTLLLILLLCMK
jgi:hypothetical protein